MQWPPDTESLQWLVGLILLLVAVEAIYLYRRYRAGFGSPPSAWFPNLLSGAFLMLALQAALMDGAWFWVVTCLSASGIAHFLEFNRHR